MAVKRVKQGTVTEENLTSVLHKVSRTLWLAANCSASFSLLFLLLLAENFLQMATKRLSPMVANLPGLFMCRKLENDTFKKCYISGRVKST